MAELVDIKTWRGVNITPLDDALIYDAAIEGSGLFYGGEITIKNANTLHIAAGHGIIAGRKFTIVDGDILIELSSSGTLQGRVYMHLDLSNTSLPLEILIQTGTSISEPRQDQNVNIINGVYEFDMAYFEISETTIFNLTDVSPGVASGAGGGSTATSDMIAPTESGSTAAAAYTYGDGLIYNRLFYRAAEDIAQGDTLTPGVNIIPTTVSNEIKNINIRTTGTQFRNYSLGTEFTTEQAEMIAAGDYSDLLNGDYWDVNGIKFRICDNTNWYRYRGDQGEGFDTPHLVIMPDENILKADNSTTRYMKDTNDTTGGYASTKYRATYRAQAKRYFTDFFGTGHIATYRGLITTATASGRASNWAWSDCDVELPTEGMMFGQARWGDGAGNGYSGGSFHGQLMLFRLAPEYIIARTAAGARENLWEQDVVSASYFAFVHHDGDADGSYASNPNVGCRPFALLI